MFPKTVLLLAATLAIAGLVHEPCTAQGESIEQAFQKALKSVEKEKAKEQEELIANLKDKLNLAINGWMEAMKKAKSAEINQFVKQNWEKLPDSKSSAYQDYHLKDFIFSVAKIDIIKTDSLITPYKATVAVIEKLYVEKDHPPGASFRDKFFYTANRMINLAFDFEADRFCVTDSKFKDYSLEPGWPEEVKAKMISR